MDTARQLFEKAYNQLKEQGMKEERVLLLDAWRGLEQQEGDADSVASVEKRLPRRIKRKRMRKDDEGNDLAWEEYFDYQFPDDQGTTSSNLKILEMAAKWKKNQQEDSDDDSDDDV